VIPADERKIVAYHEVGHALVAACQTHSAPVQKITIIPRTSGALGYTMQVDAGEKYLMSKEEALNKIATFTGGRAAEELIFHSITTGASNDIEQATKIARAMVTRYGMTDEFDMVAMETVNNQYLGGDTSLTCSPETARMIDEQVVKIVRTQHEKALNILKENEDKLHEIAKYLLDKETITGAHDRCAFGRKSFVRGLAPPIVRTANQTRTLCVLKQWFSVLTLCAPTHGFSNKCLFCNVHRRLSTLLTIKM